LESQLASPVGKIAKKNSLKEGVFC